MENILEELFGSLEPSELDELAPDDFRSKMPRGALTRIENAVFEKTGLKTKKRRVRRRLWIPAVRSLIETTETEGNTMTTKRKIRIKPLVIAIAATAVLLLAGFTTAVVKGNHVFSFNSGNSLEHAFDLELKSRELTIPEEFKTQDDGFANFDDIDMTPRELLESFGATPPFNDNFADTANGKPSVEIYYFNGNYTDVWFNYALHNKTVDKTVYFHTQYFSYTEKMTFESHYGLLPGEPTEVVKLKNGTKCMVSASKAVFSYDGAYCEFRLDYDVSMIPDNYGELTRKEQERIIEEMIEAMPGIEAVKQVLADMELL